MTEWGAPSAGRAHSNGDDRAVLTVEEVEQFEQEGFIRLRHAIPRELALSCRDLAAAQLGIDLSDPSSWNAPVRRGLVEGTDIARAANTPRLIEAIHQLLDPEAWMPRPNLGSFVVRFPSEMDPGDAGWHIDSSYQRPGSDAWYVNYRSKARGLLLLCLLSDVGLDDAPTRVKPGSHRVIAPLLRRFGDEGIIGQLAPLPVLVETTAFATGDAGDVYLCHPFLVHAASWPHRGDAPRFVSQPPISLSDSLQIDARPETLSVVARPVQQALRRK